MLAFDIKEEYKDFFAKVWNGVAKQLSNQLGNREEKSGMGSSNASIS